MACKQLASSTFAVSKRVPVVEQKLACDAHTLLGVEHAPTVPPDGDENNTDRVGGGFAAAGHASV